MTLPFARLARLLDLDRPIPGERTTWTVRTAHGVHSVELTVAVTGTQVSVDGEVVGRSPAWSFSDEPFRFTVAGSAAIIAISADIGRGTERASLLVGGEPVAQDAPAWRSHRTAPFRWGPMIARTGYLIGAALLVSGAIGDPLLAFMSTALATFVDVAWLSAVGGTAPFGIPPSSAHTIAATRAGTLLAGIELVLVVTLARDRRLQRRLPLLQSGSRVTRAAGWGLLLLAAAIAPTLLD